MFAIIFYKETSSGSTTIEWKKINLFYKKETKQKILLIEVFFKFGTILCSGLLIEK